jgi:hypothetical protein
MADSNTPHNPNHLPAKNGMGKSIFPTFHINVPMPKDTAVPGSYNKPAQHISSGTGTFKPVKAVE